MIIYRWLLKLYPVTFRERYQQAIEQQFRDEYRETSARRDRMILWLRTARDLAGSIPVELYREFGQDLKYAFRLHRKRPLPAILAIAALSLSIGVSTGIFSVLNASLLRALPFRSPEQLVELRHSPVTAGVGQAAFSQWRKESSYLDDAATFSTSEMTLAVKNGAVRVRVTETSANFPGLLGMVTVIGRTFVDDEDRPGHTNVAIISHSLWNQIFGGDVEAIGASIELNGKPLTVIGVAPARFDYPGITDIWTPAVFDFESVPKTGAFFFQTIGRLKIDLKQARQIFETETKRNLSESARGNDTQRPRMISLREELSGEVGKAAWILAGMIFFVLLIAYANLAHLLLSRIAERQTELSVRTALGASRTRLVQQLMTEATILAVIGAVSGLILAHYVSHLLSIAAPPALATQSYTVLDWSVLGFAGGLTVITALFFGILPGFLASRMQTTAHLAQGTSDSAKTASSHVRFGLLVLQACMTLIFLAASVTMGQTFLRLLKTNLGFQPKNVVTMTVSLQGTKYRTGNARWNYYREALDRLQSTPGVEAAGAVGYLPLVKQVYMAHAFKLDSGPVVGPVVTNAATAGYFRSIGTKLLAGQDFEAIQRIGSEPTVIVNEAFAQAAGLGTMVVGRKVTAPWRKTPYRISGVVETNRSAGPAHPGLPMIYWQIEEEPSPNLTLVTRVKGNPELYLAKCRDVVKAIDSSVPIYRVSTFERRLEETLARPRFWTTSILFLSGMTLFLAIVGIFGTTIQAVTQRNREIGIRMALGGSPILLRAMLLRENMIPIVFGIAAGITITLAGGRYLEYLLEDVRTIGLWPCFIAVLLIMLAGVAASWSASQRLLKIHPAESIRA